MMPGKDFETFNVVFDSKWSDNNFIMDTEDFNKLVVVSIPVFTVFLSRSRRNKKSNTGKFNRLTIETGFSFNARKI